jgi:hypothetical protein
MKANGSTMFRVHVLVNKDKRWTSTPPDLSEFEFALFAAILSAHQNRERRQPQQIDYAARLVHAARQTVTLSSDTPGFEFLPRKS